jgi:hypothetical protein
VSMTVFTTRFFKSMRLDKLVRGTIACFLWIILAYAGSPAWGAELSQLKVERADDGIYLSAVVDFDLPPVVEDALMKGIPMFFVVEADIYQSRWYWTDRQVGSATRTIRLAFQPLTRRWRVNIATGLISSSGGLRATFNQNYDTLAEALGAVQRLTHWRVADSSEVDPEAINKIEFSFRLDLSQLPRPFQIGVAGQKDWNISVQESGRIQIGTQKPASPAVDKSRVTPPTVKEAER